MREEHEQFTQALFADLPERQRAALAAGLEHVLELPAVSSPST